jgi:D-alanyl-lipoteichoic acid acyltransferase DltB (MBOAT superfamily)
MVVADSVAKYANQYFDNPASGNGWQLLWASYCFALQIYGDFSGYTDIAIGCARLFGLHMTRNFAYPYFSSNIHEFWKRWHISLSNWFRDYVYIPLGGNRCGPLRQYANALIVFVISGLWHGANWTFVLWGFLHGIYYTIYSTAGGWLSRRQFSHRKWFHFLSVIFVFHLIALGWILFRAKDLTTAFQIIYQVAALPMQSAPKPPFALFGLCLLMLAIEWLHRHRRHGLDIQRWPTPARWGTYYAIVLMILFVSPLAYVPFIYFQF